MQAKSARRYPKVLKAYLDILHMALSCVADRGNGKSSLILSAGTVGRLSSSSLAFKACTHDKSWSLARAGVLYMAAQEGAPEESRCRRRKQVKTGSKPALSVARAAERQERSGLSGPAQEGEGGSRTCHRDRCYVKTA